MSLEKYTALSYTVGLTIDSEWFYHFSILPQRGTAFYLPVHPVWHQFRIRPWLRKVQIRGINSFLLYVSFFTISYVFK